MGQGIGTTVVGLSSTFAPRIALYLSGASGNYMSTPDSAALSITGDIDLRWRGALTSWTAASQGLIGKWASAPERSYALAVASGTPQLLYSADGTNVITRNATTTLTAPASGQLWIRVTLDVDNGAAGNTVRFYQSANGTDWTQIGSDITNAGTTSIKDSTADTWVGAIHGGTYNMAGHVTRAIIKDGIDGTTVAEWDGTWPHTRQRGSLGNIWTLNGTANAWQVI